MQHRNLKQWMEQDREERKIVNKNSKQIRRKEIGKATQAEGIATKEAT